MVRLELGPEAENERDGGGELDGGARGEASDVIRHRGRRRVAGRWIITSGGGGTLS
jgi:hypothetical protein